MPPFTPFLSVPGAASVGVSVVSASKAWNLAGLKCAAVVSGSASMDAVVKRLPPDARWRIGHLGVIATVAAFGDDGGWLDDLITTLDHRRTLLAGLLRETLPMIRWTPPQATYLAWLDCRSIGPDNTARELFLERGRVALEPGLRFGPAGAGYARLNFATSEEVLTLAVQGMADSVRSPGQL